MKSELSSRKVVGKKSELSCREVVDYKIRAKWMRNGRLKSGSKMDAKWLTNTLEQTNESELSGGEEVD